MKYRHNIGNNMVVDPDEMTFDNLTSIYRVERGSSNLSTVRKDLYPAMLKLIESQAKECDRIATTNPDSIMFDGAAERKKKSVQYMKKIVELRMRKISDLALRGAMGANNIIDAMTSEEKEYYTAILEQSRSFWSLTDMRRKGHRIPAPPTTKLVANETPEEENTIVPTAEPELVKPIQKEPEKTVESTVPDDIADEDLTDSPQPIPADDLPPGELDESEDSPIPEESAVTTIETPEPAPASENEMTKIPDAAPPAMPDDSQPETVIRVLEDLPSFSGVDTVYELKKEDVVRLPTMMAKALIARGKAVFVDVRP
jgi:DNA replication factor GINS